MMAFSWIIAAPAIQLVLEKGLFGKPYIRLGKLYFTVGSWVFQEGGVVGYVSAGRPALLQKLFMDVSIDVSLEQFVEELNGTRGLVEKDLAESEGQEKTLSDLYTDRELRGLGIDIMARLPSTKLREKVSMERSYNVIGLAFAKGTAFGYHFPAKFKEYWEREYRMQPHSEWQYARAHGLALPEVQQPRLLKEAIAEVAQLALGWDSEEGHRLDSYEVKLLKKLAAGDEDIS